MPTNNQIDIGYLIFVSAMLVIYVIFKEKERRSAKKKIVENAMPTEIKAYLVSNSLEKVLSDWKEIQSITNS